MRSRVQAAFLRACLALCVAFGFAAGTPVLAQDRVVLQLQWDHQFQFAGYYAAQWQGFYREAGIEVEIRPALSPGQPLKTPLREIAEGRAQFGTSNSGVLMALADGAPVVILASIFQQSGTRGYYRADTQIRSPADLLKLKIGRNRGNELLDVELRALLAAEGVDASRLDVVLFEPERLIQGLVDRRYDLVFGYSLTVPWEVRERGYGDLRSLRPSDYGIVFYGDALIASAELARRNPDLARRFKEASLRGWQYALDNPKPTAERIARELPRTLALKDPLGFNLFQADGVAELSLYPVVQLGHTNPDRWTRMRDALLKAGVIKTAFPVEPIIFDPDRDQRARSQRQQRWLIAAIATVLLALVSAILWSRSLSRAVQARTAQLAASENRYRALVDNSPESIFIVRATPDGGYVYEGGNPATTLLSGVPEEDMRGRDLRDFLSREALDQNMGHYRRCLDTRAPVQFEYALRRGARPEIRETVLVPILDPMGRVSHLIGSSRDVTSRKEADGIMRQAQKMEAVGQLTSGIAHDFNNLLTVVVGGLEGVGRAEGDPVRTERYVGIALEAAGRAAKLTQQLLAFSRGQALQPRVADVNRLLEDFSDLVRRAAGEAVEVRFSLGSNLPCCCIDPSGFEAAILNLVVNARDAMPEGGRVTVETQAGDGPSGPVVRVRVSDTGEGMPPEVLERVFEPFFTTKEVGKGTGLGLSMVYGFVQQSGGTVRIESEPRMGTRVILELPAVPDGEAAGDGTADDAPEPRGRETVLLVEDNAGVRATAQAVLQDLGYRVVLASDGPEALRVLDDGEGIDLLFTDVVMPGGVSGLDLARRARRMRPAIRVLTTSGHMGRAEADASRDGFPNLPKPYRRRDLARAVRAAIDAPASQPEPDLEPT